VLAGLGRGVRIAAKASCVGRPEAIRDIPVHGSTGQMEQTISSRSGLAGAALAGVILFTLGTAASGDDWRSEYKDLAKRLAGDRSVIPPELMHDRHALLWT